MVDNWVALAACKGLTSTDEGADPMFPWSESSKQPVRAAKRVCAGCTVVAECLADALKRHEKWGIRGGLTSDERDAHAAGAPIRWCTRCGLRFADFEARSVCRPCTGGRGLKPADAPPSQPKPAPPPPSDPRCGTPAGVSVHHRGGTPLCGPCREVRNARDRVAVARRKEQRDPTGYEAGIAARRAMAAELVRESVTVRQAAQQMGCNMATARKYLRQAREALAVAS